MSAALPEPSLGNTGLARLRMLLGGVAREWRGIIKDGDVNGTACPGNTITSNSIVSMVMHNLY
jgi:hypothetical protein